MKTYVKMEKIGRNWYISFYDSMKNKIDVSKPYKTKKECKETLTELLQFSFCEEYKKNIFKVTFQEIKKPR